jgi:proteasome assembly chaperone (PAC2) family protein
VSHLRWYGEPPPSPNVLIAAFEGWNDAGEAASSAASFMAESWNLQRFADIDPEDFYDFTVTRPEVRLEDGRRTIEWPRNEFFGGTLPYGAGSVVVLKGTEPQLHWRGFLGAIDEVVEQLGITLVITLGALLADVPHTRPTRIVGSAFDDDVVSRLGLIKSQYEGPTGIVGVLHTRALEKQIDGASLWAAVPTYVPGTHSPKAQLSLVQRCADLLGVTVGVHDLETSTATYERTLDDLVSEDEETAAYVAELEEYFDNEEFQADVVDSARGSVDQLMSQVEQYLREQPG